MAKLLQRIKNISGCEIREYVNSDGKRHFTATILKWRNFKFTSDTLTSNQLLSEKVVPFVKELRDTLKPLTTDEQLKKVDEYPSILKY